MSIGKIVASLCFVFIVPLVASAQVTNLPNTEGGILVSISPEYPKAGERVRLQAASSFLDLSRSQITWTAGGKTIDSGVGKTETEVLAGAVGSLLEIRVSALSPDGARASGSARIRPVEIDLLWDTDAFTPPFYRGRALPSSGTKIQLYAIPRFQRANGSMIPDNEILYTWKRNGTLLSSASGRGKSKASISAPTLHGNDVISVEAVSNDGTFEGRAEVRIASREPVLNLYEFHPIFGILFHDALEAESSIASSEATFALIPYFSPAGQANDSRLRYEWTINNARVPANPQNPNQLTINAAKSDGVALIEAALTHATNLLVYSRGAWAVTFEEGPSDPFQGQTP